MTRTTRFLVLALVPLLAACGADPQYKDPAAAATTYIENGPRLEKSIDIASWNFVWYGLSKRSQKWFEENWEKICERPGYREACGAQGIEKAKMVAFGAAIAPRGPHGPVKDVKNEGKSATVTFDNWDGEMHLVKEERGNWKVDGLFGIEDVAPSNW